jgi:tRNA(Ile)-lysidine synthase
MSSHPPELPAQVLSTIRKYNLVDPLDRILVGVSGGADSVALLLVFEELGFPVAAAHLNHGLRGAESDADEKFVQELAESYGIPFVSSRSSISLAEGNMEAAGRAARQEFFQKISAEYGYTKVAVAHTRDDRVETCLLHLFRGSGLEGMVSMAPLNGMTIRPLIESSHDDVRQYLNSRNQSWRMDATNADTRFARSRMRHNTIPAIAASFNPKLVETLSRTVELLQDEDAWMKCLAEEWLAAYSRSSKGEILIEAPALGVAPPALARRVIRQALRQIGSHLRDVTFDRIECVRDLLRDGMSGKTIQLQGKLVAERAFDKIVLRHIQETELEFTFELPIPGSLHVPELGKTFRAGITDARSFTEGSGSRERVFVDGESLGACVKIRNWKPGDYYKPVGWPGGKIKKLFQRAKVPRNQRSRWPVFVTDSTIVWVASFPVSREFAPGGNSQKIVALEAISDEPFLQPEPERRRSRSLF